uniref:Thioredoxin-like protein 1 n=1 Tax=Schistocephalus solidus TaxID=70667 RepID=A0A0X3Q5Y5_SCHSO
MSTIQHIENDQSFREIVKSSDSESLIVVDFYANWCGPCKIIAPVFADLSRKYTSVKFVKVDVDKCEETAAHYHITAIPTFIFIRDGKTVDTVRTANATELQNKLELHAGKGRTGDADASTSGASALASDSGKNSAASAAPVPGYMDLGPLLQPSNCECLNCDSEHPLEHALSKDMRFLMSDTDEQLIIFLTFTQVIKLHSMRITAPDDCGPKTVKMFINQTATPDFDTCEAAEAVQELILTPENLKSHSLVPLKYVKFQNVNSLTLFVKDNQTGAEQTKITNLSLYGNPVNTTNMSDFKRVAGKKGESHG